MAPWTHRLLVVVPWLCVACAHQAATEPASGATRAPDPMDTVRRDNARLRRRVQLLEDRVIRLEQHPTASYTGVPEGRQLPVVRLNNPGAPGDAIAPTRPRVRPRARPAAPKVEPAPESVPTRSRSKTLSMVPDSGHPELLPEVEPTYVPSPVANPKSYRLVGTRLADLTKRPKPVRRKVRGRKGNAIAAKYHDAMGRYRAGETQAAEAAFETFARAHPRHDFADNALYWKGEAAYDQAHYADALAAFTEVVERYAGGNKAPDALLKIGLCYRNLGDDANARDVLSELIAAYPGARASDIARSKLAEFGG